jgi:hypothetical protein
MSGSFTKGGNDNESSKSENQWWPTKHHRKNKIEEFETSFRGKGLFVGEHGYDHARKIWNGMLDRNPGIIAR